MVKIVYILFFKYCFIYAIHILLRDFTNINNVLTF